MKSFFLISLFVASTSSVAVPLIIDTDIGGGGCMDVDDVAAVCMAHALADNGEADILAIVQNTSPAKCAGVISVLNHYYGRDHIPIGAYKGTDLNPNAYYLKYVDELVAKFPAPISNSSQVPDAVQVYRKVLAAAADQTVAVSSIGLLTNLAALFKSGPDQISGLTGLELFSKKVKVLSVMGGKYPTSGSASECNFCGCYNGADAASARTAEAATAYVIQRIPASVQVLYGGFAVGLAVQSGGRLSACTPASNPCRAAFESYEGGPNKSRYSWDPLATLVAVRGAAAASQKPCSDCDGTNTVDINSGNNHWVPGPASNQTYLLLTDATAAGNAIDQLLCQPPKAHSLLS